MHSARRRRRVAEGEDAVLAARDETVIVAEVVDSGLQVRDAPGSAADEFRTVRVRAVFSSAASCKDIDEAFGEVRIETVRIVSGRRFLRGVSARIDRHDDRCSLSCVVSYLCLVIDNGRVRAVLIFRALHISARDVDSELLIFRRSRLCAVDEADLVVNIILLIVIPLGGVHFDRFSRERSLGRFFESALSVFEAVCTKAAVVLKTCAAEGVSSAADAKDTGARPISTAAERASHFLDTILFLLNKRAADRLPIRGISFSLNHF